MVNEEGAIIHEQFRMEGLFDRLDCLGKAVLGLTIQCAQCHSHKFDPISHEEYYRLLAFLNDDYEAISWVYTDEQLKQDRDDRARKSTSSKTSSKRNIQIGSSAFAAWQAEAKKAADAWSILRRSNPSGSAVWHIPKRSRIDSVMTLGFRPEGGDLVVMGDDQDAAESPRLRLDA